MANTYVKIGSTVTVGAGGASTITFSSIPSTYTDLKVVLSARGTTSATWSDISLLFNGSSANFTAKMLYTTGLSVFSDPITNTLRIPGPSSTASTFGNLEIYIPNYASSNNKSWSSDTVTENNSSLANAVLNSLIAGLWSNSAAINSISFSADGGGTFVQYTTATLYGISKS